MGKCTNAILFFSLCSKTMGYARALGQVTDLSYGLGEPLLLSRLRRDLLHATAGSAPRRSVATRLLAL